MLDEIDSGLDIDALRDVASAVNGLKRPDSATLMVTHYKACTWVLWGLLVATGRRRRRIMSVQRNALMADSAYHKRMLAYVMQRGVV